MIIHIFQFGPEIILDLPNRMIASLLINYSFIKHAWGDKARQEYFQGRIGEYE
jgi:hypothetical protein